jgi:DNA-directed RNA polymerase specialized sigma24 family protein
MVGSDDAEAISILLSRVRAGDEAAFEQLWKHYYAKLVSLAGKAVSSGPGGVVDADDAAQSALASFYAGVMRGRYPNLHDRTGLWKLLLTITLCKARASARKARHRRKLLVKYFENGVDHIEPSPAFAAELADQFGHLMSCLPDVLVRQVAVAKLEGYSNEEIARQVGKSIPTVERKLRLIRQLWDSHVNHA